MNKIKYLSIAASVFIMALPAQATKICLDPGHGGHDSGAVGCGLLEKDINLDTELRLRDLLTAAGFQVIMTRETDVFIELTARTDYANSNGADRFVSVHTNSADASSATGTETFCHTNAGSLSVDMRDHIQAEMLLAWDLRDRGGKTANYSVLRTSNMPATLSELGFISNCSVDALKLGDPDARQQAAQAHLIAIQEHLGQDPGDAPGYLRGVVFEDQGVGTADMSVRLPGALVEVLGQNEQMNADDADAAWSFLLPAGDYTIHASMAAYLSAEKSCIVQGGGTTWCSIGLQRDESATDAGVENRDATFTVDARHDDAATQNQDANMPQDAMRGTDANISDDATTGVDSAHSLDAALAQDAGQAKPDEAAGCGCNNLDEGKSAALPFLLLLGLLVLIRKKRIAAGTLLIMVMLPLVSAQAAERTDKIQMATAQTKAPLQLNDVHRLALAKTDAPLLSPDGTKLALTTDDQSTLLVVDIDAGDDEPRVILRRRFAGLAPVWSVDSQHIGLRDARAPYSGQWLELYNLNGRFCGPLTTTKGLRVGQKNDRIVLFRGKHSQVIADEKEGDRFYAPRLSPDGRWIVYRGLQRGLFAYRLRDGKKFLLGSGDHPRFSEDGHYLVFERSHDDGHRLISAQLYISDCPPRAFKHRPAWPVTPACRCAPAS